MKKNHAPISIPFEVKILKNHVFVQSENAEQRVYVGNLSLPTLESGGVNAGTMGRAVLKIMSRGVINPPKKQDSLISVSAVARILHISPSGVRNLESKGVLKSIRTLGGHRRYWRSEVEKVFSSTYFSPESRIL